MTSTTTTSFSFETPVTATTSSIFGTSVTTTASFNLGTPAVTATSMFKTPVTTTANFSFATPVTATTSSLFGASVTTTASFNLGTPTVTASSIFRTPVTATANINFSTPVTATTSSLFGTSVTTTASFNLGTPTVTASSIFRTPVTTAANFSFPTLVAATASSISETPVTTTATFSAGTSVTSKAASSFETPVTTTTSKVSGISQSTVVSNDDITLPSKTVGLIFERQDKVSFEWAIPDFLSWDGTGFLDSPEFRFFYLSYNLRLYSKSFSKPWENLSVYLSTTGSLAETKDVCVTIAVKLSGERRMYNWKKLDSHYICLKFIEWSDLIDRKSEFLPSGILTIMCSMEKGKRNSFEDKMKSLEILSSEFKELYLTKSQCDVTIKVMDIEFKAHKAVLAARSSVFASAFEHDMLEKNTGVMNIDDCDPYSFGDFLQYLYTGEIGEISFKTASGLYVTADKYNVKELKSSCTSYMLRNLAFDNVCGVIVLADLHDETGLMSSAEDYFRRNYSKIVSTAGWELLMKTNYRLANKVLKKVVSRDEVQKAEETFTS